MYVQCKKCAAKIEIANWPGGTNSLGNVHVGGNVRIGGGAIGFGPRGLISFGPGGSVGFGGPPDAQIRCGACGNTAEYKHDEARN